MPQVSLSPLLFEKLGLIDSPEKKAAKQAEKDRIEKRRGYAKTAQGLREAFPDNRATDPKVSLNLLEGGVSANRLLDLAQQLSPESPDELTNLVADYAMRYAQHDPTLAEDEKDIAKAYMAKKFGTGNGGGELPASMEKAAIATAAALAEAEGRPLTAEDIGNELAKGRKAADIGRAPQEFNTADELALGFAMGTVTPEKYAAGMDELAKSRKRLAEAGGSGGRGGGLTTNQSLEQAETFGVARAAAISGSNQSYEPVINEEQHQEMLVTDPQNAQRYFRIKDSDDYTALTPEAQAGINDANQVLTDPARKQALADSILAQRTPQPQQSQVAPPAGAAPTGAGQEIPIEQILQELNAAGFGIDPNELKDPSAAAQLRVEYRKWVSLGRPQRSAPK